MLCDRFEGLYLSDLGEIREDDREEQLHNVEVPNDHQETEVPLCEHCRVAVHQLY